MKIDPRLHRIVAAQPYPLLFATISGAHLYGFPSPDSDFDLRGAHVLPLDKVVGLEVRDETVEQKMIVPPHPGPLPIGCGEGGELEMDTLSLRQFLFACGCRNSGD
jgi:predicted nucleotidyltransferase